MGAIPPPYVVVVIGYRPAQRNVALTTGKKIKRPNPGRRDAGNASSLCIMSAPSPVLGFLPFSEFMPRIAYRGYMPFQLVHYFGFALFLSFFGGLPLFLFFSLGWSEGSSFIIIPKLHPRAKIIANVSLAATALCASLFCGCWVTLPENIIQRTDFMLNLSGEYAHSESSFSCTFVKLTEILGELLNEKHKYDDWSRRLYIIVN